MEWGQSGSSICWGGGIIDRSLQVSGGIGVYVLCGGPERAIRKLKTKARLQ